MIGLHEGARIEMLLMANDPCPIPAGSLGTVTSIQDLSWLGKRYKDQWQVAVKWDSGRTLSLCLPEDKIRIIKKEETVV